MLTWKRLLPLLAVSALVFTHCGDSDDSSTPVDPQTGAALCLSDSSFTLDGVCDSTAVITVTNCGNTAALTWSVEADSSWISLTSTTGTTPGDFRAVSDSNRTGVERTAVISVTAGLADDPRTVEVTQGYLDPAFCVAVTDWQVSSFGGDSPPIAVENCGDPTAIEWVASTDANWLDLSAATGTTPATLVLTADTNNGSQSRTGTVTVTADGFVGSPCVIEVEQPCPLALAGSFATPAYTHDVRYGGDYMYVSCNEAGFEIFDVSEPSAPVMVGSCATSDEARHFCVAGNYAYVLCTGAMALDIIDISDPTNPAVVGTFDTQVPAFDVSVSGDFAYLACLNIGLKVVDVSDPTDPSEAGNYNTGLSAFGTFVSGDHVFLADQSCLQIINIEDPTSPTLTGNLDVIGSQSFGVSVSGDHAYLCTDLSRLLVVDISSLSAPTLVGTCSLPFSGYDVFIRDEFALVACGDAGLVVASVQDPTAPAQLTRYNTSGFTRNTSAFGDLAGVADYQGGLLLMRLGF